MGQNKLILQKRNITRLLFKIFDVNFIGISLLIFSWLILYLFYLINHDIPVNPGGYYLESAKQLAENNFFIPDYVKGFGVKGIPYVYSPLGFYVLAITSPIFGGIIKSALFIPGFLLLIQSILMYYFMKLWTKSVYAPLWAALILLLSPHIFYRTLFADGLQPGLLVFFYCYPGLR